jgi:hypothetical protein
MQSASSNLCCPFSKNQDEQRAFRHPLAKCTNSQKHLLWVPSKAQHRLYPCRDVSIRSIGTAVIAYLFYDCSLSENSLLWHRPDNATISLRSVGLLRRESTIRSLCFSSHTFVIPVTNILGAIALVGMLFWHTPMTRSLSSSSEQPC